MRRALRQSIREVMESNPTNETTGVPPADLAEAFDVSRVLVLNWMNDLIDSGDVIRVASDHPGSPFASAANFKWIQG